MAITMRQVVLALSIIYLLFLSGLAAYAMHATQVYRLPIPTSLTAFALALPLVSGLAIEAATTLARKGAPRHDALTLRGTQSGSSLPLMLTLSVLLVYETVVVTLAGTHIGLLASLGCGLEENWRKLFSGKDETAIRSIQDRFGCCGLRSPTDMAWPFPNKGDRRNKACTEMYGRTSSCFETLRSEEQKVAGMLIAVGLGVFLWKVIMISIPTNQPSWFSQRFDDDASTRVEHRALEYQGEEPYCDQAPSVDEIRNEVNQGTQRAIEDIKVRKKNRKAAVQPSSLAHNANE